MYIQKSQMYFFEKSKRLGLACKKSYWRKIWIMLIPGLACAIFLVYVLCPSTPVYSMHPRELRMSASTPDYSTHNTIEEIAKEMPNVPVDFWYSHKSDAVGLYNNTCAKFPNIFELNYYNNYWQTFRAKSVTFHLYGAYLDTRSGLEDGPIVRILAMIDKKQSATVKVHCQFWYVESNTPVFMQSTNYVPLWVSTLYKFSNGALLPYLFECPLPRHLVETPRSVSIAENKCDFANNHLKIVYEYPGRKAVKKGFAVCVKGLDYLHEDLSVRLIEWIELLGLLGVDKIFLAEFAVHPRMSVVLNYYEKLGRVHVKPFTLTGLVPNAPILRNAFLQQKESGSTNNKWLHELIVYNDCFYRNMYQYEYIIPLDFGEVILPAKVLTWQQLFRAHRNNSNFTPPYGSITFTNAYLSEDTQLSATSAFKETSSYLHGLQHARKLKNCMLSNCSMKSFMNTSHVVVVQDHLPASCLHRRYFCIVSDNPLDYVVMHYGRRACSGDGKCKFSGNSNSSSGINNSTVWRYKNASAERVQEVLRNLGYSSTPVSLI